MSSSLNLAEARAYCRRLAFKHYENFPVGRWGVAPVRRPDIHAVYAFARVADDFADEPQYDGQRLDRLEEWERKLEACLNGAEDPVFLALGDTIRRLDLPLASFKDLLSAFKQDVVKQRYDNWDEVLDYCRRSANPIGRLVLLITGQRDQALLELSDSLCTALQLTNFWQDLSVDLPRGRCYLPRAEAERCAVDLEALVRGQPQEGSGKLLALVCDRTLAFFADARPLPGKLRGRLRMEIAATWHGGVAILRRTTVLGERALAVRPTLSFMKKVGIVLQALRGRV